jgi:hypothetical protein
MTQTKVLGTNERTRGREREREKERKRERFGKKTEKPFYLKFAKSISFFCFEKQW